MNTATTKWESEWEKKKKTQEEAVVRILVTNPTIQNGPTPYWDEFTKIQKCSPKIIKCSLEKIGPLNAFLMHFIPYNELQREEIPPFQSASSQISLTRVEAQEANTFTELHSARIPRR